MVSLIQAFSFEDLIGGIIECFSQEELLVNVTKHELVPKHQILKEHEKAELLKKYRVKDAQLPKI